MAVRRIVVIGASAGGVEALSRLMALLPGDLPAAVFITLHLPPEARSYLPEILTRAGRLPAQHAQEGELIRAAKVYVAPSDHHLLIARGRMHLSRGPRENRHRPAIDPLFRSAAEAYGQRVVGIILTGALDDGTAGLASIKEWGGTTIVQDPNEAASCGMPESALRYVQVDYCLPIAQMGPMLDALVRSHRLPKSVPVKKQKTISPTVRKNQGDPREASNSPTGFICPECNGPLWEFKNGKNLSFQCLVGHRFSPESLLVEEGEALERVLWVAARTLMERGSLLRRMAERARAVNQPVLARSFLEKAKESDRDAEVIRRTIEKGALKKEAALKPKKRAKRRRRAS